VVPTVTDTVCAVYRCRREPVVWIICHGPPLRMAACSVHPATVIWWIKGKFPGHRGIRTKSIKEER